MLKLPGRLRVIERGGFPGECELIHQLLRLALLILEQKRQENPELDQLRCLILCRPPGVSAKSASSRSRDFAYSPFLNGICAD